MKEETENKKVIGIIYLQGGNKNDWRERRFHDISEIREEMLRRNIRIGDNVEIGRMVMLGDGCTIENGSRIGNEAVIDKGAYIGQNCNIEEMAIVAEQACLLGNVNMEKDSFVGYNTLVYNGVTIGKASEIGAGCHVGKDSEIGDNTVIHYNSNIGNDCRIGKDIFIGNRTSIENFCVIETKAVIGNCVNLRQQSLVAESQRVPHFEQVQGKYMPKSGITDATFIRQNDGSYSIRCKVNGIQQPAEPLGRKESAAIAGKIGGWSKEEKNSLADAIARKHYGNTEYKEQNNNTISRSI